ncbi:MAG: hypothetical protein ACKE9I_01275 [Methylophagaceae bacterium]
MFQKMINQAFGNLENNNHDLALLSIVPLFDKACKKTWPRLGVGARFRKGIEETEDIISFVMLGGRGTITASTYGKWTLPELMYKYLRNSIIHEGQMPDQVKIIDEPTIVIDEEFVQFPIGIVLGLLIATIGFECFRNESRNVTQVGRMEIKEQKIFIKDMVGNHQTIRDVINN